MSRNAVELEKLRQWLAQTAFEEIDCEDFLHRVAGLIERVQAGGSLPKKDAELLQHLRVCPECTEEYEMLRRILGES